MLDPFEQVTDQYPTPDPEKTIRRTTLNAGRPSIIPHSSKSLITYRADHTICGELTFWSMVSVRVSSLEYHDSLHTGIDGIHSPTLRDPWSIGHHFGHIIALV